MCLQGEKSCYVCRKLSLHIINSNSINNELLIHLINMCIPLSLKSNSQSVFVYQFFTLLFHVINAFLPLFSSSTSFLIRSRRMKYGPFSFCCSIEDKRTLYTTAFVGILSITLDKKRLFFFYRYASVYQLFVSTATLDIHYLAGVLLHRLGL